MSYNPKLEFFTFPLNHKEKDKTFRDFAIECLDVDKTKTDQEVFKACFEYFMSIPESGFAENDRLKKVLTWINNKDVNIHYDKKPSLFSSENVFAGVITGGKYGEDGILSNMEDKNQCQVLGRKKPVLKYFYIFVYLPINHNEGFFMIHSNSHEETITNIFRDYIATVFTKGEYKRPIVSKFCPKKFQDEFKNGALLTSFNFKTTFLDTIPSDDPILQEIDKFDINITITPSKKAQIPWNAAEKLMSIIGKHQFKGDKGSKELEDFDKVRMKTHNEGAKSSKSFSWDTKDKEFTPVVYLEGLTDIKYYTDGTPDFDTLKTYTMSLFNNEILPEIRKDLYIKKFD